MSFSATPFDTLPLEQSDVEVPSVERDAMIMEDRSPYQVLYLCLPLAIASIAAVAEGIPFLTDVSFLLLSALCGIFLIGEFRAFSFRWGIGGLLLYGGVLIWFCHDYIVHWMGRGTFLEEGTYGVPMETVARAGAHHMLFVVCMALGLRIKLGGRPERILAKFPEPANNRVYVALFLLMLVLGLVPYAFFTREGLIQAFWNDFVGGRAGGALWTIGRTGNVNYNFGAYLAQLMQVGTMGAILGSFYAICIAKTWTGRVIGIVAWVPVAMLSFGSGSRGNLLAVVLPLVGFFFIRFQSQAAAILRRASLRAYLSLGALLLSLLLLVQVQITFRGVGFRDAAIDTVLDRQVEGNGMFSESLRGFYLIPKYLQPFYDRVPGQAIVMPVVDTVYWFVVSPVPRAIWTSKPLDPVWLWYNNVVAGTTGTEGTTVSNGAVGTWYFRFGIWGTIEGGLIIGYLMGMTERLLRNYSPRKPILIIMALANATFLFRCYRGLQWVEYHGTLVGLVALALLILVLNVLLGGGGTPQQQLTSDAEA